MNPFFDPRELTDQQLYDKMQDINARLILANRWGMAHEASEQLFAILQSCELEYYERNQLKIYQEMNKDRPSSVIIGEDEPESEPEGDSEEQ